MSIETELLKKFPSLDPARIARAVELVYRPGMVMAASRDEQGRTIRRDAKLLAVVRSGNSNRFYYVRPKSCTCPDHAKGNVCKHRIASYIMHTFLAEYQRLLVAGPKISATCPLCGYSDNDVKNLLCPQCLTTRTVNLQTEMEIKQ